MEQRPRPFYILLPGFFLFYSLFFVVDHVRDFLTPGEGFYLPIIAGSFMGALAVYWIRAVYDEFRNY